MPVGFVDKSFTSCGWVLGYSHCTCKENNDLGKKLYAYSLYFSWLWVDVPPRALAVGQMWTGEV